MEKSEQNATVPEPLRYATPESKKPHSVWSVVGLGISLVFSIPAAMMCWMVIEAKRNGPIHMHSTVRVTSPAASFSFYGIPIVLCMIGLRRGRKSLAIAGIVITVLSLVAMAIVNLGSPW